MDWNALIRQVAVGLMAALLGVSTQAQGSGTAQTASSAADPSTAQAVTPPLVLALPMSNPHAAPGALANAKLNSSGFLAPSGLFANALVGGILGGWLTSSAGKQIKEFQRATPDTDWDELAAEAFHCVGIQPGQKCRNVILFNGDEKDLRSRLRMSGASQAVVIVLLQQFDGKRYRARATLRDMDLTGNVPKVLRVFTTIYNSDTPEGVHGNSAKLHNYWLSGTSPFLRQEGETSLAQLNDMLNTLNARDHDEHSEPDGWKELKSIRAFEATGVAHCHGFDCMGTRAYADHGDHIWITGEGHSREDGWLLISLDRNAALRNANATYQSLPVL